MSKTKDNEKITVQHSKVSAGLIRAFQAGDRAAFNTLVVMYKNVVFHMCFRMLGDYQEADDTAQEVFVRVFTSIKKFRFESAFSTWLYRITVNMCKNRLSSSEYRHKDKMVRIHNPSEKGNAFIDIEDKSQSPHGALEKKERSLIIHKAIQKLPEEQKIVVVLRDIQGLSYEEIASITGLKSGTVKSRLARARLALRQQLKGVI